MAKERFIIAAIIAAGTEIGKDTAKETVLTTKYAITTVIDYLDNISPDTANLLESHGSLLGSSDFTVS